MKAGVVMLVAAASLAGCASSGRMELVEQGYDRGALGVAAIDRGDYAAAERNLNRNSGVSADDPARLINLGSVYMQTGRPGMAMSAWRLALASDRAFDVETGDGRVVSTRTLAQELLDRYEPGLRSAGVN